MTLEDQRKQEELEQKRTAEIKRCRTDILSAFKSLEEKPKYLAQAQELVASINEARLYNIDPYRTRWEERTGVVINFYEEDKTGYPRAVVFDWEAKRIMRTGISEGRPIIMLIDTFVEGISYNPEDWINYHDQLMQEIGRHK